MSRSIKVKIIFPLFAQISRREHVRDKSPGVVFFLHFSFVLSQEKSAIQVHQHQDLKLPKTQISQSFCQFLGSRWQIHLFDASIKCEIVTASFKSLYTSAQVCSCERFDKRYKCDELVLLDHWNVYFIFWLLLSARATADAEILKLWSDFWV